MSLRSIKRTLLSCPTYLDSVIMLEPSFETNVKEYGVRELANSNVKSRDEAICYWCWMPWIGKAIILKRRRVELMSILLN
jgi:hypothetical protein